MTRGKADERPAYEAIDLATAGEDGELGQVFEAARLLLRLPVDEAVSFILASVGEAAEADRAWMFEYDAELVSFRNSHEWSRRGIASFVNDLQGAPVTMIAWLHRHLLAGKAVMINRVEDLPRAASPLRAEMLRQGNASVLSVPIIHEGRLRACFGLDAMRQPRRWHGKDIQALFLIAELIAIARYGATGAADATAKASALIYLRSQNGARGVEPAMIVSLQAARNHTEVTLADGSLIRDQRPIGFWSSLLPSASFVRIHRTTIVNLLHVSEIDRSRPGSWKLALRHGAGGLPVSRPYRQELKSRLGL